MKRIPLLSTLSLVFLAVGCRTAGPRVAPTAAAPPDLLASYVGELRLLRQGAEKPKVELDTRARPPQGCAVAVAIRSAALVKGSARFSLETLGTPRVREQRVVCRRLQPQVELTLTGFSGSPEAALVKARVDAILQTPEAYLESRNVRFDLAPGVSPTEVASREVFATRAEATLGARVTTWPLPLLTVDPWYRDRSGRIRQQSEVEVDAVVGSDGRLHQPRVRTPLGAAHASCVLRPLPLWRFTPARREDKPVAARVALRPVLHIY